MDECDVIGDFERVSVGSHLGREGSYWNEHPMIGIHAHIGLPYTLLRSVP